MCLLDRRLDGNADAEQLEKACRIACWCIQDAEDHRPMMGQVVHMLEGVMDVEVPPIPRSLQYFVGMEDNNTQSAECPAHHGPTIIPPYVLRWASLTNRGCRLPTPGALASASGCVLVDRRRGCGRAGIDAPVTRRQIGLVTVSPPPLLPTPDGQSVPNL
ncbi:Os01g0222800 [Oryza sativa Japonica Group]|uniref:Os01g0222800 protein n=1 Tax=Oryza sativa subsp. japonica TaxID=39947 RepID=A0A0P0UZW1_ORYSJ|nr:hypothetical protein EE612_001137 [Oryza sativa]BAS71086.1 Os01g0222800 [Oryza sativa Japonica Group]